MDSSSDSQLTKYLDRISSGCSLLAVGFGSLVLTGWVFHINRFKTILPAQVAIKANTAVCFITMGIALWLLRKEDPHRRQTSRRAARLLALLVSVVGLLSFLEYLYGWDAGIDRLLIKAGAEDALGSVRPGLMSPITAIGFLLLGFVLLLLDSKVAPWRFLAQLLTVTAAVLCTFGILDFVLDFNTGHTFIALPTALLLFLLCFGLIAARPEWGLGRLLASSGAGGTLARRLLPAAVVVPLVIGWLRTKGQAAGLYSEWTGIAIMTVSAATLLAAITVWTAFVIDRTDSQRQRAQESAQRLATIVTASSDAIFGETLQGTVTSWNPGAEAMYGYSAEEIAGQSLTLAVPPDRRVEFEAMMQAIGQGEQIRHFETVRRHKDGHLFHVSLSISPVRDKSGHIVGASTVARDISERKRGEEKIQRLNRTLRALSECTERLMRATDEATVLQQVCEVVVKVAGYRMAWVGYAERDEQRTVRPMAAAGSEEGYLKTANVTWADVERGRGPTGTCIRNGKADICQDVLNDPRMAPWREQALRDGFRSSMALPLRVDAEVIGALTMYAGELGRFEIEEQQLLEELASNMTYAIMTLRARTERMQAEHALNHSETRYRSLVTATAQIVWTTDAQGQVVEDMPLWREFTGMSLEQILRAGWLGSLHRTIDNGRRRSGPKRGVSGLCTTRNTGSGDAMGNTGCSR